MGLLSSLITSLRSPPITESEVRAEAWALGSRHRGEVVAGARVELASPDLSIRRAILLKAVIRKHAA